MDHSMRRGWRPSQDIVTHASTKYFFWAPGSSLILRRIIYTLQDIGRKVPKQESGSGLRLRQLAGSLAEGSVAARGSTAINH